MAKRHSTEPLPVRARRLWRRGRRFLTHDLWSLESGGLPTFRQLLLWASRVTFLAVRGFRRDRCMFHAAALTYISVLSIVPVLAFAFSMAKGLGAYDRLVDTIIAPALDRAFPAAGLEEGSANGVRLAIERVLQFVDQTDVSKLGLFGLAVLLWTVVKMLGSVERSFNEIWGVKSSRTLVRKVTDYLAIVLVTPIFLLCAGALIGAVRFNQAIGFLQDVHLAPLLDVALRVAPLLVAWMAFTFVYLCLPNRRMQLASAALGGVAGGSLWLLLQVSFLELQLWTARFNELYASFAAFPIFLVWIYLSWVTVLFGAEVASAHHRVPTYRGSAHLGPIPHALTEVLALRALTEIASAYLAGREPWTATRLSERLHVPEPWLEEILGSLADEGLLARLADEGPGGFVPARDPSVIRASDVLAALRGDRMQESFPPRTPAARRVERLLDGFARAAADSPHDHTLRELGLEALRDGERDREAAGEPVSEPG